MKINSLLLVFGLLLGGCSTLSPGVNQDNLSEIAKVAAATGTRIAILNNPDYRPSFEIAVESIDLLLQSEVYDPVKLWEVLSKLPIKELRGEKGAIIIDTTIMLYGLYADRLMKVDQIEQIRPVIQSIRDGMAIALRLE